MKRVIVANAQFWLDTLNAVSQDTPIPEADIRGAARALEAVATIPEVWPLAQELALSLHSHMERRGYWADWDSFLQVLVARAREREDSAAEAELLIRHGAIQRQRGEYQAAIASYRRAWWFYWRAGDEAGCASALSNLGDLYRLQKRFWRAEILCWRALALFRALEDITEQARVENHLGLVYFDQALWDQALPHFARSETLWQQARDRHGLAKVLQNLGVIRRYMGNPELALDCLLRAIHHYHAVGDEIHAARTHLNIGNIYLDRENWLEAERAYAQAETVLRRAGDSRDLATARNNLGIVYTHLENYREAEACFERALEQWRNQKDTWNLANTLGELSGLHLAQGDRIKARACLDEAWKLVQGQYDGHYALLRRELAEREQELG